MLCKQKFLDEVESLMHKTVLGDEIETVGRIVSEHLKTGGKRLRAQIALATTEILLGDMKQATLWAVACELLHNATLIHDDLQDQDTMRRGYPTTWVLHGQNQAINAGDLIFVLPFLLISKISCKDHIKTELCRILAERSASIIRGQAHEIALLKEGKTDRKSYQKMIELKTGALFGLPVEGAMLLSGKSIKYSYAIAQFFSKLGVIFQLQDDILDLFGDKGRQEVGCDLREGKISAIVVEHLAIFPEEKNKLLSLLRTKREDISSDTISLFIQKFHDEGALEHVKKNMQKIIISTSKDLKEYNEDKIFVFWNKLKDFILQPIQHML